MGKRGDYVAEWKAKCPRCDKEYNSRKTKYICNNCERGLVKAWFGPSEAFLGCNRCGEISLFANECECGANFSNQVVESKSYIWLYVLVVVVLCGFVYFKIESYFQPNTNPIPKSKTEEIQVKPQVSIQTEPKQQSNEDEKTQTKEQPPEKP